MSDRSSLVCPPNQLHNPSILHIGAATPAQALALSLTISAVQHPFPYLECPYDVSDVDYLCEIEESAPLGW